MNRILVFWQCTYFHDKIIYVTFAICQNKQAKEVDFSDFNSCAKKGVCINKLFDLRATLFGKCHLSTSLQYSCNNITTTLIQISRLFYFGFFSKTNHQMMI